MATIIPEGERVKQAVKWIAGELNKGDSEKCYSLIQEAATRFNLSPKDEEFLRAFYTCNK